MSLEHSIVWNITLGDKPTPDDVPIPISEEEGATCGRKYTDSNNQVYQCLGTLEYQEVENCVCHYLFNPPCYKCATAKLHCPECGWEEDDV